MPDREKVIKGLEELLENMQRMNQGFFCGVLSSAIELLNEQEAVKPKSKSRHGEYPQIVHRCGNCNEILYRYYKFCPTCGRVVKWE